MLSRRSLWSIVLLGVGLCLVASGCSDEDPVAPPVPGLFLPETPDELMEAFEKAYEDMDIEMYRDLLHPAFKFVFMPGDSLWYELEDVAHVEYMFTGNESTGDPLRPKPGVTSITINSLNRTTGWVDVPSDDPVFPNTLKATFEVYMVLCQRDCYMTTSVHSEQIFYIAEGQVDPGDGILHTRYYLRGQADVTQSRPNEIISWSGLKTLYADPDAYTWPDTPQEAVTNFVRAYDEMNEDAFVATLHDDFRFIGIDCLYDWGRVTERLAAQHMFNGMRGLNNHGEFHPPIANITVQSFEQQTDWVTLPDYVADFPGARWAIFTPTVVFNFEGGTYTATSYGDQIFYVKSVDEIVGGVTLPRYMVIGHEEIGPNKDTAVTWGDMKDRYRWPIPD